MKKSILLAFAVVSCTAKLEYLSLDKESTPNQLKLGYLLIADQVMDDTF